MTKNRLSDLNDHLFAQLERLGQDDLTVEQIEAEVARSEAIIGVSTQVMKNADIHLKAAQMLADNGLAFQDALPMPLAVNGGQGAIGSRARVATIEHTGDA